MFHSLLCLSSHWSGNKSGTVTVFYKETRLNLYKKYQYSKSLAVI